MKKQTITQFKKEIKSRLLKTCLFILIPFSLSLIPCAYGAANTISYQGRLRESGQPVSGTRNFNFKLFNAASAGDQIWTSGDIPVLVSSGVYSTQIGNDDLKNLDFADNDYWLEISVGGNAFSPREKISAVPYAFNASTATNVMGAGNIQITGAGTHYIANGNLGIGTTNPAAKLSIYDTNESASHMLRITPPSNFEIVVSTQGRVGIGTTNPLLGLLEIMPQEFNNANGITFRAGSGTTGRIYLIENGSDDFNLIIGRGTSATKGIAIENTGYVGMGTTNPSVQLDVTGSIEYSGTITDVSDARLKENVKPVLNPLEKLKGINGVYFNMIGFSEKELGVIAQDVQKVIPEAVNVVDDEKGYLGVNYIGLIPVLIEAVKKLDDQNKELIRRIGVLEEKLK